MSFLESEEEKKPLEELDVAQRFLEREVVGHSQSREIQNKLNVRI